ncbi:MAG: hypothetical protein BWX49_00383 [Bacteroidetes bacterium ADurb.Bin008]|nr:MAG: hypothetical protein BWX49_00383 [Bacteroidetes bacterium ADurb.Bin008]
MENNPKFYFMFNLLIVIRIIFFLFFCFYYLSHYLSNNRYFSLKSCNLTYC